MSALPPAGWYPDPTGQGGERWWDGSAWTEALRASMSPAGGSQCTPAPQPRVANPFTPDHQAAQGHSGYQTHPAYQAYLGYPVHAGKPTATPDGVPLGGLGARLGARLLDGVLQSVVIVLLSLPWLIPFLHRFFDYLDEEMNRQAQLGYADPNPFGIYSETGFWSFFLVYEVLRLAISAAHTVLMLHLCGGTVGKLACGVRVRSWELEGKPTWGQSWKRWLTGDLAGAFLGWYGLLDWLWPTWDQRKQALHDKWGGTVVVARH